MITRENLQEYKNMHEEVSQKIEEVLTEVTIIRTDETYRGDITSVEFLDGTVEVMTVECVYGCGDEIEYYTFPEEFLYEEWEDKYREEIRRKKKEQEWIRIEEERIEEQKRTIRDRETYEKLKRIFEKDS